MKQRVRISIFLLIFANCVCAEPATYQVALTRGVAVHMRDGVVLRADIYRPKADGKFPVLLTRTPYDKSGETDFALKAAAAGYVVIAQDVRGRYTSEGEWYPFLHESEDGYDTVEWAAALPYSNQKVGMFGGSYVGATQMLAAIVHPPHLAGICPVVTASNYHNGWVYQGGAFEQWFNESWTSILAQDTLRRISVKGSNAFPQREKLPLASYTLFQLPSLARPSEMMAALAPYFSDWLAHPNYDDYWKRWSIEEHYPDIKVPALTVAAWYDIFQGGSLRNYLGMKEHGGTYLGRQKQRLLITIGGHAGSGRKIGDVDFGPAAKAYPEDTITLSWYGYLFKGVENQFSSNKRVKFFLMGSNEWREADDWPVPQAQSAKFFLHSQGTANSLRGNGSLSEQSPQAETPDGYVYDPANPVPTRGSSLCCDPKIPNGPQDQRATEARKDVLVYSTPALTQDMEVVGPVSVELFAASSARDTDFTAKLVDVRPDGYAQNLTEGIIRARYRDSQEKPTLLKPGEKYKVRIDLWSTGDLFKKGHILRLEVSSSNSPRFDRNLNTGEAAGSATKSIAARNTIFHDAGHPSVLTLPVVSR